MGITMENKLIEAGYKLFGTDNSIEKLILNILKTKDNRYLKAIPFLIYKHNVRISKIRSTVDCEMNELFQTILFITFKLFSEFNINNGSLDSLKKDYDGNLNKSEKDIKKEGLDYNEFKDEFELQLKNETKPSLFIDKQKIYAERDLQMYLSQIFTKKEKQIIRRLLEEKPISKTDYEYYSRKTKKKLGSIIGLQDFAKSIYEKNPKCDEKLYYLKRKLEEFIENNYNKKYVDLIEFFLWNDDLVSLNYKLKDSSENFNIKIKLNQIKNEEFLSILRLYDKHDFR